MAYPARVDEQFANMRRLMRERGTDDRLQRDYDELAALHAQHHTQNALILRLEAHAQRLRAELGEEDEED